MNNDYKSFKRYKKLYAGEEYTDDDFYFIYEYVVCKAVDKVPEFKIVYTK